VLLEATTDRADGPSSLSPGELEEKLAELCSHLYAGMCRWLELVAEFDRRGSWAAVGCRSCAEWLAWRCALTPRAAREHVRVARRLDELPLVHGAFASCELSYAKVRALARVADPQTEAELLDLARVMSAAQLERSLGAYRRVTAENATPTEQGCALPRRSGNADPSRAQAAAGALQRPRPGQPPAETRDRR
jgi:hypothetical protein